MGVCRDACGGDMNKFLVMLVVAVRTAMHRDFASLSQEELLTGDLRVLPGLGANARSIAETLGVPKETVRRKVSELIEAGWLARQRGRLYATSRSYRELAPMRDELQTLVAHYYEVVSALKARTEEEAADRPL
jgi:hypothetical protein